MVGALLLIMGLSLSKPGKIDAPIATAESDTTGSATESMVAEAPALEVVEEAVPEPPWQDFTVETAGDEALADYPRYPLEN